ncbi:MSHA biogenesis protein MshG [hydrothermal vent metagenome]|uniref:MSHA biogenesis protein MshG n=1 Tax=hydrothermal vent metagenome TaxID=652676 RepID=A0A3B0ZK71_9ZZZZ
MPAFSYKGRLSNGKQAQGTIEAINTDVVVAQLLSDGITPISINETQVKHDILKEIQQKLLERKPSYDDLILFSRQMYTLMHAGVPIIKAITGLSNNTRNPLFSRVLRDIGIDLESGHELTAAMSKHGKVFSNLFISMIKIGETTGNLDEAFLTLSGYLDREKDIRDRIKSAMRYPVTVMGFILAAMTILNIYVIPQFQNLFNNFKAELPLSTRILIITSDFFVNYWPAMLLALIASIIAIIRYVNTSKGKYNWDRYKLKIPLTGSIILRATLARFSRAFSMSTKAGVPLIQALNVVSMAVDNDFVASKILEIKTGIERGDTLTRTTSSTNLFTPLVIQMLAVGEETGAVDELLEEVADFYEREVDYDLKKLSSAIEPIMIVVIGVMVLILAMGIFLPMWELAAVAT